MKIKDLIKQDPGFQYVIDSMEFMSTAGRHAMLNFPFIVDPEPLIEEHRRLAETIARIQAPDNKRSYTDLRHCLMQLHDLHGSLASLADHSTLNEVELFEIKNLARITTKATEAIANMQLAAVLPMPNIEPAFRLLDPDNAGTVNFYIYDSYDLRLAPLRRELRTLQEHNGSPQRISELLDEQNEIQKQVCVHLSDQLRPMHSDLLQAMEQMAYADCLTAKAELCIAWQLAQPTLGDDICLQGLFSPRLRDRNAQLGLRYQPVDISLRQGVTLITGANMAGKTVLLKSIATAQTMVQCGLFAPATSAVTTTFETIATSIGDDQNEMNGLSSYAAEIIKISNIVKQSRQSKMLILIDEPARTTNPVEGKALVQSIITILEQKQSISLITTHYGQLGSTCRRLRVVGFVEDMADVPLTPQNIGRFIDYSLIDDQGDDVPHEALRIASILQCDDELISLSQQNIAR